MFDSSDENYENSSDVKKIEQLLDAQEQDVYVVKNNQLIVCNGDLFLDSYNKIEDIKKLPFEEICWSIEEVKLGPASDKRLIVLSEISTQSLPQVLETSAAMKTSISLKDQALGLISYACLHPVRKNARRPYNLVLKNIMDSQILHEISKYGIQIIERLTNGQPDNDQREEIIFYVCHECGLKATKDFFITCQKCNAIYYCDEMCKENSFKKEHRRQCKKFKSCLNMEHALARLCFEFTKDFTNREFTTRKLQSFLKSHEIFDKGLWRRESQLPCYADVPYGVLQCDEKPYILSLEGVVLQSPPTENQKLTEPLCDWADYYKFRGFWLDSPIAGLLHYPLTLYWVITTCLPKHYPRTYENVLQSKAIEVHILGAEKESEMFHPFLELARLLSPLDIRLHLFGDKIDRNCSRHIENLSFNLHPGLYHTSRSNVSTSLHIAMGFNAGLSAYPSFKETIDVLLNDAIPLYCTDYCYLSVLHSTRALVKAKVGCIQDVQINPFHSPFRIFSADMNLPRYSNAFIFHISKAADSTDCQHST